MKLTRRQLCWWPWAEEHERLATEFHKPHMNVYAAGIHDVCAMSDIKNWK